MKEHAHTITADYQCSPACPAHGLPLIPDALVHIDNPTDAHQALTNYIHTIPYALEGRPHYARMIWETHVAFTFWALTPWRWND